MNNLNKFAFNPVNLDISRSRFPKPYDHKTTLESGALVPFYVDEVMAGDTFEMNFKSLTRMLTPVVPTMDNLFQDIWFFFVPLSSPLKTVRISASYSFHASEIQIICFSFNWQFPLPSYNFTVPSVRPDLWVRSVLWARPAL